MKVTMRVAEVMGEIGGHDAFPYGVRDDFERVVHGGSSFVGVDSWTDGITRSIVRRLGGDERRDGSAELAEEALRPLRSAACIRLAWATIRGDPSMVRAGEAEVAARVARSSVEGCDGFLAALAARGPDAGVPAPDDAASPFEPFDVAFAWGRARRARPEPTVSTGRIVLVETDPDRAPVTFRLRSATGDAIDLRTHGGVTLRPVLSPGSWKPVDARAFRTSAAYGVAWADNPFVPHDAFLPLASVAEVATREGPRLSVQPSAGRDEAWKSIRAAAGTLHVIDGIVHRECPAPVAHLSRAGQGILRTSWSIEGQLTSDDDQTSLRLGREGRVPFDVEPTDPHSFPMRFPDALTSVPLGDAPLLEDMLSPLTRASGAKVSREDVPFEVTRPDLVRSDAASAHVRLLGWVEAARPFGIKSKVLAELLARCERAIADVRAGGEGADLPDPSSLLRGNDLAPRGDLCHDDMVRFACVLRSQALAHPGRVRGEEPDLSTFTP